MEYIIILNFCYKNVLLMTIKSHERNLVGGYVYRLAGVTLVVPVMNYWWPSFDSEMVNREFKKQLKRDRWKLRISHYAPGLVYWWMTQKIFPNSSIMQGHPILGNPRDVQTIMQMSKVPMPHDVSFILSLTPSSCYVLYIHFQLV